MEKLKDWIKKSRTKIVGLFEEAKKLSEKSGKEKMDYVVTAINSAIDIPVLPEGVEEVLFRAALELVYQGWKAAIKG